VGFKKLQTYQKVGTMKNSKRVQRIVHSLDELVDILNFYTNNSKQFDNKINEIRDFIEEMGLETKERDTRLAKKLKNHWNLSKKEDIDNN